MKIKWVYPLLVLIVLIADQWSKWIVARTIPLNGSISVIPDFFDIVHVRNRGAIFGFFSGAENSVVTIILTSTSLAAFLLVVYYFFKTPASEKLLKFSLTLIMAGAMGNLFDRIFRGYVIDFLDVFIKRWHWPSFNIADSCITVGALLLIYSFIFKGSSTCSPYSSK